MKKIYLFLILFALASCTSNSEKEKMTNNSPNKNEISVVEEKNSKEEPKSIESSSNDEILDKKEANTLAYFDELSRDSSVTKVKKTQSKETVEQKEAVGATVEDIKEYAYSEPSLEEYVENAERVRNNFLKYTSLTSFLKAHVSSSGKVNYAKIKTNMAQLDAIIKEIEENYPTADWSRNEKLVYWINAYNVYTLKLVASNYPLKSIKDITAKPWHKKFIKLGGSTISLNDIEHSKIRGNYNEPRIHFALNCASGSCPILLNKAFTTQSLNYQLTALTKRYLKDSAQNDFSNPKSIKISSLFNWYKEDFAKKEGSVIDFINKYRTEQLKNPKISYLDYDWSLND
ncbi:MAG: DUF547 domain-containing protein [Fluviicola sp.]|nr:DUF547 domain-containing protein [Fluviicola sp.]